jgi:hypothetical protein
MHPNALAAVQKAVRHYVVLDDDDPILKLVLASVLCNFAPDRDVPMWLVLVGPPGSVKTDIISLVQTWRHTWSLPPKLTDAYFFSASTRQQSALHRIKAGGYRILYLEDMAALIDGIDRLYAGSIYQQIRGIHDGYLKKETGFDSRPLIYGNEVPLQDGETEPRVEPIPPTERLGFIGAATQEFYAWHRRHASLGARFTAYLWQPHGEWTNYSMLVEIDQRRAERAHWRKPAESAVHSFLNAALQEIDQIVDVEINDVRRGKLAAAVKLVQRIAGTVAVTDTGARLHARAVALCRMMAFISGRRDVTDIEIEIAKRMIFSQLAQEQHNVIRHAISKNGEPWAVKDLLLSAGGTRRVYDRILADLVDVGVLESAGGRGKYGQVYGLSADARGLADVFRA